MNKSKIVSFGLVIGFLVSMIVPQIAGANPPDICDVPGTNTQCVGLWHEGEFIRVCLDNTGGSESECRDWVQE